MPGRVVGQLLAAVAVFGVVALVAVLLVGNRPDEGPAPGAPSPSRAPTTSAEPPPPPSERVLAVKIDNVQAARPHTGLGAAEVIYVEPVEGGLTRLAAVYTARLPRVVGPVRSARESDVRLLAQYGAPTLAFSGAAPEIRPALRGSPLRLAPPPRVPGAYFREGARPQPHNLFVRPARLPGGRGPAPRHVLDFGPAPAGGAPTARRAVRFPAAGFGFTWVPRQARWLVSMNGTPMRSTESGRVSAATVVVQRVALRKGTRVRDAAGYVSPVVRTVGTGKATVLRNGRSFAATWSRPVPGKGTTFTVRGDTPLPMAEGPVWILLLPR